jgi:hypothetical protein
MNTPSPAIVSDLAVQRLPKYALIALCVIYVLTGSFGRDPWKSIDLTSLGYMMSLANHSSSLFNINMAGIAPELDALLPYWLGMLAMQWLTWLSPDIAARSVFALFNLFGMGCLWLGIYFLGRNPKAQPVAFAFGGQANPKDYAWSMADAGLLAYIACLGLALPSHEITPMAFQLNSVCIIFASAASLAFYPTIGIMGVLLSSILLSLSGAPTIGSIFFAGISILWLQHPQSTKNQKLFLVAAFITIVSLIFYLELWQWRIVKTYELRAKIKEQAELLIWFLWPAWPLAAWSIWKWRSHWQQQAWTQHLTIPIFFFVITLFSSLFTENSDRTLLLVLPSISALAAFALPTFSRAAASLVDWFTLLFFTVCALAIWIVWISLETGIPTQPALNVYKLVPGYMHQFQLLPLITAVAATVFWIKLVIWRVGRHPSALWKSLILPAGGTSLCWILLMTLWLPFLDHALSYRTWTQQLRQIIGNDTCIYFSNIDRHQIAGFSFHGNFVFEHISEPKQTCHWLLIKPSQKTTPSIPNKSEWLFQQTMVRPGDKNDVISIYKRVAPSKHD